MNLQPIVDALVKLIESLKGPFTVLMVAIGVRNDERKNQEIADTKQADAIRDAVRNAGDGFGMSDEAMAAYVKRRRKKIRP